MKNKWLIPVVLFVVLVIGYVIRGIFETRITLEMLQIDRVEECVSGQGVLIKSERVNTISTGGITDISVKSGERVANGQLIATVYSGTDDPNAKNELADVNKRIDALKGNHAADAVFINDASIIENEIAETVETVIRNASVYNMETISEQKYRIVTLADQKAVAKGEKPTFSNDLTKLQAEKSQIVAKLGTVENVVVADAPGVFYEGCDGFEGSLTPDGITNLSPSNVTDTVEQLKKGKVFHQEEGNYTYKIVNNYSYFVAVNVDDSMSGELRTGEQVYIRFSDFSKQNYPATVRHISEKDGSNQRVVVVECSSYVDGLLSKRVVNVDFVKKSVEGYKVKVEYLHTVDNAVGLFIKRGAVMRFVPVTIIYSTDEEAIVSAATSENPIKSYDEVVTSAPEFYDGRVIVSQ